MDTETDIALMVRLARISAEFITEPDHYEGVARSIVSKAIDFVPGCEAAAVTRRERSRLTLVAATDERAAACVDLELAVNDGPTLTAVWHSEVSVVEALASDVRWPGWAAGAQEQGIASALSLRLAVGNERLGALTMLNTHQHEWSPRELSLAVAFATHASTAMYTAKLADTVHFTVEARHGIGLAQGVLMQRYGVSKEAAFRLLQRYSNATNTKVRDLAVMVYERGDLPPMPHKAVGAGSHHHRRPA